MKYYFDKVIKLDTNVNGEYYCSLAYNYMVDDNLKVGIYELEHFMQWGTPQDVDEYNYYSNIFHNLLDLNTKESNSNSLFNGHTILLTMAGAGSRFAKEGFSLPKPLLNVRDNPMFVSAIKTLPQSENVSFSCLSTHEVDFNITTTVRDYFPSAKIKIVETVLQGQANTVNASFDILPDKGPITITACDHQLLYSNSKFNQFCDNASDFDVIVWSCQGFPGAAKKPEMYGWLEVDSNNLVKSCKVKQVPKDPNTDFLITGTFTFRDKQVLQTCIKSLLDSKDTVNGEYYVDSIINLAQRLGLNVYHFQVSSYVCWGTPVDYKSFEYWSSCFKIWNTHPYSKVVS